MEQRMLTLDYAELDPTCDLDGPSDMQAAVFTHQGSDAHFLLFYIPDGPIGGVQALDDAGRELLDALPYTDDPERNGRVVGVWANRQCWRRIAGVKVDDLRPIDEEECV